MSKSPSVTESMIFEDDGYRISSSAVSMSVPASDDTPAAPRRRFKSSRLIGELEKPWLHDTQKKKRWISFDKGVFTGCMVIAFGLGIFLCYRSYASVPKHDYCMVLDDQFQTLDLTNTWSREVQVGGFGTGSFDWTTEDDLNSYTDANGLHIVPTITTQSTNITVDQLANGAIVNLTSAGTCTSDTQRVNSAATTTTPTADSYDKNCIAISNSTKGTIVNPVRSARLTTKGKKSIKYGRVEVVAQMPKGDWLWPAIWMMPENSVYGDWPRSGEIDIVESRGNDAEKYALGNNIISSTLHWGTSYSNDMYKLTTAEWGAVRTKYSNGLHTFGMEWSEKYMLFWVDKKLRQILYLDFPSPNLYSYGKLAQTTVNGSIADNPWAVNGVTAQNAPFDQSFYLILNVAVGGTNGWFPDGMGNKPWVDANTGSAARDFWKAQSIWEPTWGTGATRGMTVKSVKMWQEGKCTS